MRESAGVPLGPAMQSRVELAALALDHLDVGVLAYDAAGVIVEVNNRAAALLGRERADVRGRALLELDWRGVHEDGSPWPPESHPAMVTRATGQPVGGVVMGVWHESGRIRWLLVATSPLPAASSPPWGVVASLRDITDELLLRRETQQRDAELRRLTDDAVDLIVRLSLDGRILDISAGSRFVLGITPEALSGTELLDLVHRDDRVATGEMLRSLVRGDGPLTFTFRVHDAGGDEHWLEARARVVPDHITGLPAETLAVLRDVSDRRTAAARLAAAEQLADAGFSSSQIGLVMLDANGLVVRANHASAQLLGVESNDYTAWGTLSHAGIHHVTRPDGSVVVLDVLATPIAHDAAGTDGGTPDHLFLQMIDTTERVRFETELALAEFRFRDAFDAAPIGMAVVGLDDRIVDANPAFCEMTGYGRDRLATSRLSSLAHHDDVAKLEGALARLTDQDHTERPVGPPTPESDTTAVVEVRLVHSRGWSVWSMLHASLSRRREGEPARMLVQLVDVTDRRRLEDELRHLADHDPLTGLPNRRSFARALSDHLTRVIRYGADGALLALDLDHLKIVNDTLGHQRGDDMIVATARALRHRLRSSDVVARLGGDEFAVLLPHATRPEAEIVAAALVDGVRAAGAAIVGDADPVTASIGIATFDDPALTAYDVSAHADAAMYEAKKLGGNRFA